MTIISSPQRFREEKEKEKPVLWWQDEVMIGLNRQNRTTLQTGVETGVTTFGGVALQYNGGVAL